jgi:hypothetical protein
MFWDLVLRRLHSTFGDALPHGPVAAFRLLALAGQRQRLQPAALHDLSILLLVLTCPPNSDLRARADREFLRRGLHLPAARTRVAGAVRAVAPARTAELLALLQRGTPHQRGLAAEFLLHAFGPRLASFLGRLLLTDAAAQRTPAVRAVVQVLGRFARLPPGAVDFPCYLYRRVLGQLTPGALPTELPAAGPSDLAEDERPFLAACLSRLGGAERVGLYLSLYTGLSARQIACVLSAVRPWTEDRAVQRLAACWEAVLRELHSGYGLNGA